MKGRFTVETRLDEITEGTYRISTYAPGIAPPAGFTFVQFLVAGEEPLLFHTGMRALPLTTLAVLHGSSLDGRCARALNDLADAPESRFGPESDFVIEPSVPAAPHPGLE